MNRATVLFVTADPLSAPPGVSAPRLLLDEEYRRVRETVRASAHPDAFEFDLRLAARPDDLVQALNERRPRIVHFSGHSQSGGIVLVGENGRPHLVPPAALEQLFEVFRGEIQLVVLNACLTLPQAQAIANTVGCAIGAGSEIADQAAITFSASLYRALAFGMSVQAAFDQARLSLAMEHPHQQDVPRLMTGPGVDASQVRLIDESGGTGEVPASARVPGAPERAGGDGPALVVLSRLPVTRREVFGREDVFAALDAAWSGESTHVVVISAQGGIGKTALVNRWLAELARERYRGAARVFGWSFYSQGTGDPVAPADLFLETALRTFGDPEPLRGSAWDRGERLARRVRAEPTLLVLDGLEPLQQGPGEQEGRLKDRAVGALLVELAAQNPGLCVVTTRLPVADLGPFLGATVHEVGLEGLSPDAGSELLRSLGVLDTGPGELVEASRAFGGHPLALTLLGNYLGDACGGDVRGWRELGPLLEEPRAGGRARRMLRAYAQWFEGRPELSVLRLLGFFDRPADAAALRALRAPPGIPGLTDALPAGDRAWNGALAALRRSSLAAEPTPGDPGLVDAHPLVREYFAAEVRESAPDAWREGNARLFEHLASSAPEFPDTLEEMAPLYAAVGHGREAGRAEEAIRDVYERRIQRGEEFYAVRTLGSAALDLACLAGFFRSPWHELMPGLPEDMQARLFNRVGFYLRAVGRLAEAVEPTEAAAELRAKGGEWKDAVLNAATVAELNVLTGRLARARADGERCIAFADRGDNLLAASVSRSTLGHVLHQLGEIAGALELFEASERSEVARGLRFNILYSLRGYQYADLLLDVGRVEEGCERAGTMLGWAAERRSLLDQGLSRLVLARGAVMRGAVDEGLAESRAALDLLQQADSVHHITRAYLVHAASLLAAGEDAEVEHALSFARRHADRAGLRLHLIDCDVVAARLLWRRREATAARALLEAASAAAARDAYGRRLAEIKELIAMIDSAPSGAPSPVAAA